ncbi:unnamed protein product [Echinostoma caproni]|uniref:Ovule protein n=1 Tax=Echinostoma caproni TaxID=27848 RepID=A0A183B7E8_9TREM|nr:unnamed protein product [Echinostoma caproni]
MIRGDPNFAHPSGYLPAVPFSSVHPDTQSPMFEIGRNDAAQANPKRPVVGNSERPMAYMNSKPVSKHDRRQRNGGVIPVTPGCPEFKHRDKELEEASGFLSLGSI